MANSNNPNPPIGSTDSALTPHVSGGNDGNAGQAGSGSGGNPHGQMTDPLTPRRTSSVMSNAEIPSPYTAQTSQRVNENYNINAQLPPIFDGTSNWRIWKAKLRLFFEIKNITMSDVRQQRNILLSLLSEKILDDVFGEFGETVVYETTYDRIIAYLDKVYGETKNMTSHRHDFHQLSEKDDGPLKFLRDLKNKALACDFRSIRDFTDYSITMVYLTGVKDPNLRYLLLKEPALDALKAEEITRQYIATTEALGNIGKNHGKSATGSAPGELHQVHHKKDSGQRKFQKPFNKAQKVTCQKCGRIGHQTSDCYSKSSRHPSRNHSHRRQSHRSHKPRFNPSRHPRKNRVNELNEDFDSDEYHLHSIDNFSKEPPRMVKVLINQKPIEMEIDTGAQISIIGESDYRKLGKPKIIASAGKVTSYGTHVAMIGKISAKCELDGKTAETRIAVSKGMKKISLLGRDLISLLDMDMGPHYHYSRNRTTPSSWMKESPAIASLEIHDKNPSVRTELLEILEENKEVFSPTKGHCTVAEADIELVEDAKPVFCKARRVPPALKPAVDKSYDKLLEEGMIKPMSWSEWATPMVIVPKSNNEVRLCGDFKVTVNPRIKVDAYPLPRPEDLFDAVIGGKKFSKLDLKNAFLQVPLSKKAKGLMVINTHRGLFQYQYLPFGVASAPAIFQRIMETLLAGIPGVIVYLDDITVTAPNDREHLKRLREVIGRLKKAGLRVKPEKCQFLLPEVQFLGHVVNSEGVRPIHEKVEAIKKMPPPQNIKELQAFIGMVGYYGKFIPKLSTLSQPLNELRQKDAKWSWGEKQKQAFEGIKAMLSHSTTLAHYDPNQEVVLATDASDYGLGAVLYHRYQNGHEKVVAYASRVMTPTERKYAQIEKEALGIVWGIDKFNHYIYGRKFTLLTDHQPLVKIFGSKADLPVVAARRLHRWAVKLSMYQYDIEYIRTNDFGHADGLSRLPCPGDKPTRYLIKNEHVIREVQEETLERIAISPEELREATIKDSILSKVKKLVLTGKWPNKNRDPKLAPYFTRKDELDLVADVLCWNSRAVIPQSLQSRVIRQLHRTHAGIVRMKSLARETVWFPNLDKSLEDVTARCRRCCETGPEKESVPLHPWSVPDRAWQRIHIDFAGPFLQHMWLIVVDAKTKWPEVIKLNKATTTTTVKELKRIFATHGFAELIVSDNGTPFTSEEWKQFLKENAIRHTLAPPYHPKSNGLAERFVRTFKEAITKMSPKASELDDAVNNFLQLYRATPHPATGKSPAEMMLGRQIRTPLSIVWHDNTVNEIPETKDSYRARMKRNYDKHTRERSFKVNDPVYARNLREGPKWYPGIIEKTTGSSMYLVQTDRGLWSRHADQLKPRVPELTTTVQTQTKMSSIAQSKPEELEKVQNMVIRAEGFAQNNTPVEQNGSSEEANVQNQVITQSMRELNNRMTHNLKTAIGNKSFGSLISSLMTQTSQPGLIEVFTPQGVEGVTEKDTRKHVTFAGPTPKKTKSSLPRKQTPAKPVTAIRKSARLQEKYALKPPLPYSVQKARRQ